ncbi:MAG: hypothetical protein Rubg2KO_28730 [Rubricoccaceae bacterium]
MKHTLLFALSLLMVAPALAQNRVGQDVVWARDVGTAEITVDGELNEAVWADAETLVFKWDSPLGLPGSGQFIESNPNGFLAPADASDATLYILRKGNDLYLAVDAKDKSIGGGPNLWNFDGLIMSTVNKNDLPDDFSERDDYFANPREEMFYGWYNRGRQQDTTATGAVLPNLNAFMFSESFGLAYDDSTGTLDRAAVDAATTIDGISNDDFNGNATQTDDVGYVMEMKIALDSLGWDLTEPMSRFPISIALQDADYRWTDDASQYILSRTWWQGRWGNNYNQGVGFIAGDPGVTVSSGAVPEYNEPEFRVPNANNTAAPIIDGVLDEEAWANSKPIFTYNYQPDPADLETDFPGVLAPYYFFYFHPGNATDNPVIDPTEGRIHMFYRGSKLYIGLDTDDQAINGIQGENGRDGFRLHIRSLDSLQSGLQYSLETLRMDISIDSMGMPRIENLPDDGAGEIVVGEDLNVAVGLKGSSTVADPNDIDTGYQIEVELDLAALGYADDLNGQQVWLSTAFFDGDALQDDAQSTGWRTWILTERNQGASLQGYFDPTIDLSVASEDDASEAGFRSLGSAPNPSTGLTRLRYELPQATEVTVEIFDVLGRRVQELKAGLQAEGRQSVEIDGAALGAGTYLYRVTMTDGASVTGRMTIVR